MIAARTAAAPCQLQTGWIPSQPKHAQPTTKIYNNAILFLRHNTFFFSFPVQNQNLPSVLNLGAPFFAKRFNRTTGSRKHTTHAATKS